MRAGIKQAIGAIIIMAAGFTIAMMDSNGGIYYSIGVLIGGIITMWVTAE